MKGKSFEIAISAISASLAVIFLSIGAFVPVFDLTAYMLSSIILMLPLSKKIYLGGFLAYIATVLLTLLISGGNFVYVLPVAIFFGLHPFINSMQLKYNVNKYVALIVKIIWFDISLLLMYHFTELFIAENETISQFIIKYVYIAIPVLGSAFFVFYDWFIMRAQKIVNIFVERYKK
jgi:hypothetical protein